MIVFPLLIIGALAIIPLVGIFIVIVERFRR